MENIATLNDDESIKININTPLSQKLLYSQLGWLQF